ncbi:MAG: hypothetical protein N0C84_00580 [Candidatus Thiodiazotropha taylori]|uniref:Uncharacterized protein n=1 Tax=Candidatus Thiodiazotropha taylori TaxID=2792791 RepID=A0A9E4KA55_9GAMM|nr:hypothetical protein [Candidatus Thiodiazotropha taylori]MCW4254940.1 hypothetical protein [Candidatus Thiodiazotropha taylori]
MIVNILIGTAVISSIIVATLAYKSSASFILKLIILPLLLGTFAGLIHTVYVYRGTPVELKPAEFKYQHHQTVLEGNELYTYMWAITDDTHRLYKFPYERENEKELQKGKQEKQQGKIVQGEFTTKPQDGTQELTIKGEYLQNENETKNTNTRDSGDDSTSSSD